MKILLMTGAYKNAGDFLITQRGEDLVKALIPGCEVTRHVVNVPFGDKLDEINGYDLILFPGGPGYRDGYYPKLAPMCEPLSALKPRLAILGMGCSLVDPSEKALREYRFADRTFWERVQRDAGFLGCRDDVTVRLLKNNGFASALMVGCPAWYDLANAERPTLADDYSFPPKKIRISDPGQVRQNGDQCAELVSYVHKRYPDAQIEFVFHRGIEQDQHTPQATAEKNLLLKQRVEALGIPCFNIAYSDKGFSHYDDADLHIGFRVHAHIYTLSKRRPSLLIEEDGRGTGADEALCLPSITAYSRQLKIDPVQWLKCKLRKRPYQPKPSRNPNIVQEAAAALDRMEADPEQYFSKTFQRMCESYRLMEQKIKELSV